MSNINPNNIDGAYPVAGQDNDSQGFRTNFTVIKNNFTTAKNEIDDLQSKVIVKSALNGVTLDNNMSGTVLTAAEIRDTRETVRDFGITNGTITINRSEAHNYAIDPNGNFSLSFEGFGAVPGKLLKFRLFVTIGSGATGTVMTLPGGASGFVGIENIRGLVSGTTYDVQFDVAGTRAFEFVTIDGGTTFLIEEMSVADTVIQQRTITNSIGEATDKIGDIAVDANYIYVCFAEYDGSTAIWRRSGFDAF